MTDHTASSHSTSDLDRPITTRSPATPADSSKQVSSSFEICEPEYLRHPAAVTRVNSTYAVYLRAATDYADASMQILNDAGTQSVRRSLEEQGYAAWDVDHLMRDLSEKHRAYGMTRQAVAAAGGAHAPTAATRSCQEAAADFSHVAKDNFQRMGGAQVLRKALQDNGVAKENITTLLKSLAKSHKRFEEANRAMVAAICMVPQPR